MVQRYTTLAGYVEDDDGYFVEYEYYAELLRTLAASRSYVALEAKTGNPHAIGLLRAIDRALKDD